jgi:hypothetical protein
MSHLDQSVWSACPRGALSEIETHSQHAEVGELARGGHGHIERRGVRSVGLSLRTRPRHASQDQIQAPFQALMQSRALARKL